MEKELDGSYEPGCAEPGLAGKVNDEGTRVALDVKAGDLILFGKYTSQEVKLDGEEYLIMREDEVLAVIDDGGTTPTLTSKKK